MTFQLRHLFLALILHGLLFALLAGGAQCSRKPLSPPVIRAVLLDPNRQEIREQKKKEEQLRKREEQRRKEETRRKEEEKKREDQQRRAAEEEKQRKEAELEAKRQAEIKKKADEAQRRKELEEKKKQEEAARKKQEEDLRREKERQLKLEAQARESMEQALQQEALQRQVDQEQRARAKTERDLAFAKWQTQVSDKVRRNWIRPPSAAEKFECKVLVQQLPGGQVTRATITESCGNPALNESVVKAVLRSDPLPTVSDPSLFQREFTFVFIP